MIYPLFLIRGESASKIVDLLCESGGSVWIHHFYPEFYCCLLGWDRHTSKEAWNLQQISQTNKPLYYHPIWGAEVNFCFDWSVGTEREFSLMLSTLDWLENVPFIDRSWN